MTDAEKAAAWDAVARGIVNHWWDGSYSWFCLSPCGGPARATPDAAAADFLAWARRQKKSW